MKSLPRGTLPSVLVGALAVFIFGEPLFAGVMDKELSRPELLAAALVCGAIGFVVCRLKPLLIVVAAPLTAALPLIAVMETYDRYVGLAMRREAGASYVIEVHAALVVVVAANIIGAAIGVRQRTRTKIETASADTTLPRPR